MSAKPAKKKSVATPAAANDHGDWTPPEGVNAPLVLSIIVLAVMVMLLNETLLSVALPFIMNDFGISAATAQWLTTGYMLTMAIVMPTTGFLINRFSTRTILATALSAFCVGTFIGAIAPAFWVLMAARVVQAFGNALMLPLLMTVALIIIEPARRGTIMGLVGVAISASPALGPTVSGFILEHLTWHYLFWLALPLGALTLIGGLVFLRNVGQNRRIPLDAASVVLSVFAFGGLVYAIGAISQVLSGESWLPLVALAIGVITLIIFVLRQITLAKEDRALLDLRPLTVRPFVLSVIVMATGLGMLIGTMTVLPLHLQNGMGISALTTGLVVLPGALAQGAVSPVVGRLYDSMGPRPLIIPGTALVAIALFCYSTVGRGFPMPALVATHIVLCVGLAMIITPLMTLSLSSLPTRLYAHGSAIVNTLQQLAGAIGVAVLVGVMSIGLGRAAANGASAADAQLAGSHIAFLVGGGVATAAFVVTLFIRRPAPHRSVLE